MSIKTARGCADIDAIGFNITNAAEDTWEALLSADAFVPGLYRFKSINNATLKVDAEKLLNHPRQLQIVIGYFTTFPCVMSAEVLIPVPDGMNEFTRLVGKELEKPVVRTFQPDKDIDYVFDFLSDADRDLALTADRLSVLEDVVTSLGSVAGIRRLLKPEQDVHSLAMLLRGKVNPQYQAGLTDHYLLEREIPTDKDEFYRKLAEEWS